MSEEKDYSKQILEFSIFNELETHPDAVRELSRLMKLESFVSRDFIVDENRNDSKMFFLLEGQIEINKIDQKGQIVVLGKADASSHPYFGESTLLGNFQRTANVIAFTQCECLSLLAEDFEKFMSTHSYAAANIYRSIAKTLFNRLSKLDKDIFIASLSLKKQGG